MDVTIQEAYAEACTALGEAVIRERLLTKALAQATATDAPEATRPPMGMAQYDGYPPNSCRDCEASGSENHDNNCSNAKCGECHGQLISCGGHPPDKGQ